MDIDIKHRYPGIKKNSSDRPTPSNVNAYFIATTVIFSRRYVLTLESGGIMGLEPVIAIPGEMATAVV